MQVHCRLYAFTDRALKMIKNGRKSNFFSISVLADFLASYRYVEFRPKRLLNFESMGINYFSPLRRERLSLKRVQETHFPSIYFLNKSFTEFLASWVKDLAAGS